MKTGKIYAVRCGREFVPMFLKDKGRHKYFDGQGRELPPEKSAECVAWNPPVLTWVDAWGNEFFSGSGAVEPNYFDWHKGGEAL